MVLLEKVNQARRLRNGTRLRLKTRIFENRRRTGKPRSASVISKIRRRSYRSTRKRKLKGSVPETHRRRLMNICLRTIRRRSYICARKSKLE